MKSFGNDSESTIYGGHEPAGGQIFERMNSTDSSIVALLREQMSNSDLKSEEITTLKVTIANLEALLDKKEEICQSQALKISDLSEENAILKQKASDSMEKLMKLQASHFDLTNMLNNKTELCDELSEKVDDLTYKINTFRKTSCVM